MMDSVIGARSGADGSQNERLLVAVIRGAGWRGRAGYHLRGAVPRVAAPWDSALLSVDYRDGQRLRPKLFVCGLMEPNSLLGGALTLPCLALHSGVIPILERTGNMNDQDKLIQTVAITEVINRYFAVLDQKQFDVTTMRRIFADDARIVRPNGAVTKGPNEIGDSHSQSLSRFQATQHLTSGFIITLNDDTSAEFRANLVAMHLWAKGHGDPNVDPNDNYFLAGGVISGHLILGASGWRITEITNQVSWRRGTGFQQMLQMR
jgi:SnoaL-like domain